MQDNGTLTAREIIAREYGSSRNLLTPHRIAVGKLGRTAAYELSAGGGIEPGTKLYGVSVVRVVDGRTERDHDCSCAFSSLEAANEHVERLREGEQERWTVVENTPGYLPDDDDPPVFESYAAAVAYANELADEYEHNPDGNYEVDRSCASSENTYCIVVHDRDREHDLGRVIEVLRREEEGSC